MAAQQSGYYIGLMSGTSLDGIDAALVRIESSNGDIEAIELVSSHFLPLPMALKTALIKLSSNQDMRVFQLGQAQVELAEISAIAVNRLLEQCQMMAADITAIGCHGVTIGHYPDADKPFSMQITDGSVLSARTGIDVITDFRMMDIAASGQGAPLVPPFHQAILQNRIDNAIVLNLGGIANITALKAGFPVLGYDTGPANTLLNLWCEKHLGQPYDKGGVWAASGQLNTQLLHQLLQEPYFNRPAPKSCGKELFNLGWLQRVLDRLNLVDIQSNDVQCTLVHLTAKTIADQVLKFDDIDSVLVCGGGVHNGFLMSCLNQYLPQLEIQSTMAVGVCPDNMEAMAFAWLAWCRVNHKFGNLPSVTGAGQQRVLGAWYRH